MKAFRYHEDVKRGSDDFPLDYHYVTPSHPRYEMPYHWHGEAEILRVLEGELMLDLDGQAIPLQAGDVCFISPGSLHGAVPKECVYECVVLDLQQIIAGSEACRALFADIISGKADINPYYPSGSDIAQRAVSGMFEALSQRYKGYELITLGCLYAFVGNIIRHGAYTARKRSSGKERSAVKKMKTVLRMIEERLDNPPAPKELASSVGMSLNCFYHFFRQATGRSPVEYTTYCRIEQACRLMASTEQNISEIAASVGYGDPAYFSNYFKKFKGITPREYMKRIREGG